MSVLYGINAVQKQNSERTAQFIRSLKPLMKNLQISRMLILSNGKAPQADKICSEAAL